MYDNLEDVRIEGRRVNRMRGEYKEYALEIWGKADYKPGIRYWIPADTEQNYLKNLSNNESRRLLEINGWIDNTIEYEFNEHGFRSESLLDKKCVILFNGCSNTVGVGLPLDKLWTYMIAQHYDIPHHNLGIGGSDWIHVAQRTAYWVPKLKPRILIVKEPPTGRINWWSSIERRNGTAGYTDKELLNCTLHSPEDERIHFPLVDMLTDANTMWYKTSSKKVIETVCKENGCRLLYVFGGGIVKLLEGLGHDDTFNGKLIKEDLARDLLHTGVMEQNYQVKYVLQRLKEIL